MPFIPISQSKSSGKTPDKSKGFIPIGDRKKGTSNFISLTKKKKRPSFISLAGQGKKLRSLSKVRELQPQQQRRSVEEIFGKKKFPYKPENRFQNLKTTKEIKEIKSRDYGHWTTPARSGGGYSGKKQHPYDVAVEDFAKYPETAQNLFIEGRKKHEGWKRLERQDKMSPILTRIRNAGHIPPKKGENIEKYVKEKTPQAIEGRVYDILTGKVEAPILREAPEEEAQAFKTKFKKDKWYHSIARGALPKGLEKKVGLAEKREPTIKERIKEVGEAQIEYAKDVGEIKYFAPIGAAKALSNFRYLPSNIRIKARRAMGGMDAADAIGEEKWETRAERTIAKQRELAQKLKENYKGGYLLPGISISEVANLPENAAYSTVTWGTALMVSAPAWLAPEPTGTTKAAAYAASMGVTGTVSYRMTTYEIMDQYLEMKNEEKLEKEGRELTVAEQEQLRQDFESKATKYGLWESIPEAAGSVFGIGALQGKFTKMLGKKTTKELLARAGITQLDEMMQETITEMGQVSIRKEAKMPGGRDVDWTSPNDWYVALKDVAPQTFLLTTMMSGGGAVAVNTKRAVQSLKKEIGEGHPQFDKLKKSIKERLGPLAEGRVGLTIKDVSEENMDDSKRDAMKEDVAFQDHLARQELDMNEMDNRELAEEYKRFRKDVEVGEIKEVPDNIISKKKSEVRNYVKEREKILDPEGNAIEKLGVPTINTATALGSDTTRPTLTWGGYNEGVVTDSFLLIKNKKVAQGIIKKIAKKEVEEGQSVDEFIQRKVEINKEDFPNWKEIEGSTELFEDKANLLGHYYNKKGDNFATVFEAGGKTAVFNTDIFSFLKKHFPKAELRLDSEDTINHPLQFVQDGEVEAILMPMKPGANFPSVFDEIASKGVEEVAEVEEAEEIEMEGEIPESIGGYTLTEGAQNLYRSVQDKLATELENYKDEFKKYIKNIVERDNKNEIDRSVISEAAQYLDVHANEGTDAFKTHIEALRNPDKEMPFYQNAKEIGVDSAIPEIGELFNELQQTVSNLPDESYRFLKVMVGEEFGIEEGGANLTYENLSTLKDLLDRAEQIRKQEYEGEDQITKAILADAYRQFRQEEAPARAEVPEELQPLAEEARKYESAEEFENNLLEVDKKLGEIAVREKKDVYGKFIYDFDILFERPGSVDIADYASRYIPEYKGKDFSIIKEEALENPPRRGASVDEAIIAYLEEDVRKVARNRLKDFYNQVTEEAPAEEEIEEAEEVEEVEEERVAEEEKIEKAQEEVEKLKEEYERDIYPANLAEKVSKVYERIAKVRETGESIGRIVQQETILKEIEHGQDMAKREGYQEAKKHLKKLKNAIYQYGKKKLEPDDRGKLNAKIRDAKNTRDVMKAYSYINELVERVQKKEIKNDVIKLQKKALDSPSVAVDYKERIRDLLDDFELKGHTEPYLKKLRSTKEYMERKQAKGEDVELPSRLLENLKILSRKPLEEITLSQMKSLKEEVARLEKLGRTKWGLKQARYEREREEIKKKLVEGSNSIENSSKIEAEEVGGKLTLSERFRNTVRAQMDRARRIDKAILPIDALMDILDGGYGTYDGPNYSLIKGTVDKNFTNYLEEKWKVVDPVVDLTEELDLDNQNLERIGFVGAREQEGGVEKLKNLGFTEEEINEVELTDNERKFLEKIKEEMNKQYPYIKDIMKDLYNKEVGKVKNYLPFMTDWEAVKDAEVYQRLGETAEQIGLKADQGYKTKKTEQGFTIERKGPGKQKIKLNALEIFNKHIDNVAYMRAMARDAKMLFEIVNSDAYQQSAGDLGQMFMLEYMDLVARKGRAAGQEQIAILDSLRRNVSAGILGLKISTALIQWTPVVDGAGEIGVKWETKGIKDFITDQKKAEFVKKFPEIKERMGGETSIRELRETLWGKMQRKGFIPLGKVDKAAAAATALGAYQKKMTELGKEINWDAEPNQEALQYAQRVLRRTQSSALFKDVPLAISKGLLTGNKSLDRVILQFQNFILTRWSRIRLDVVEAGIKGENRKKSAKIAAATTFSILAATASRLAIYRLKDFLLGDDDDEDNRMLRSFLYELYGSVPFVGNIMSMAIYRAEPVPILDAPKTLVTGLKSAITSEDKTRAILRATEGFAQMTGVPGAYEFGSTLRDYLRRKEEREKEGKGRNIEIKTRSEKNEGRNIEIKRR